MTYDYCRNVRHDDGNHENGDDDDGDDDNDDDDDILCLMSKSYIFDFASSLWELSDDLLTVV